jgi:hypothetical protein
MPANGILKIRTPPELRSNLQRYLLLATQLTGEYVHLCKTFVGQKKLELLAT